MIRYAHRRREVILDYHGVRAIFQVNSQYPHINLPIRHLGHYMGDDTLSKDSDDDIRFTPANQHATLDGQSLELWVAQERTYTP